MRVALFSTCVVDAAAPRIADAAGRVLRRLGHAVRSTRGTTCCGQPAWNAGFANEAATVARTTLRALEGDDADVICVPAGSCATMMKVFWPELFHVTGDEQSRQAATRLAGRIAEFSQIAADGGAVRGGRRIAYHHSCHMLRELGLRDTPLQALDGHDIVDWRGDDRCCGFGGLFSVKQPETSVAMADDKIDALADTGAEMLVGCDWSCLMHLDGRIRRRGMTLPVRHLAEVMDDD